MSRTPAQVAEFNAEVARLRAARIAADTAPAFETGNGHFDRMDGHFLYLGRDKNGPARTGIPARLRGGRRGYQIVQVTGKGERVLAEFGTATQFWAQRIPA